MFYLDIVYTVENWEKEKEEQNKMDSKQTYLAS